MNEASQWRFALAQQIGKSYAANLKAKVVMVAGSTGRGTADRYSDLEIDVYWSAPPTDAERRTAAEGSGGVLLALSDYEEDEWAEDMLAARDDQLLLYDIFCQVERQVLGALLGLNRVYLPNPTFKSMDELIAEMRIKPPALSARLKQAFHLPPLEGVQHLHNLMEDIFALVETHMPEFDTAPYRQKVRQRRGAWDQPPES